MTGRSAELVTLVDTIRKINFNIASIGNRADFFKLEHNVLKLVRNTIKPASRTLLVEPRHHL